MKNIFFSYCWGDNEKYQTVSIVSIVSFVEKLIKKLEYKKENFYLDQKTNNVGDQYWKNIRNAIETSQLFIFFNSPNYCNSSSCCKEYVWALKKSQNSDFKIIEIKLETSNLYRPYNDEIYVKYDDENILDKIYNAIYKNNFNGFSTPKIFHDLKTVENSDGTTTIKFKLSRDIIRPELVFLVNKGDNECINDIVKFNLKGAFCEDTDDIPYHSNSITLDGVTIDTTKFNFRKSVFPRSVMYENEEIEIIYAKKSNPVLILIYDPKTDNGHIIGMTI